MLTRTHKILSLKPLKIVLGAQNRKNLFLSDMKTTNNDTHHLGNHKKSTHNHNISITYHETLKKVNHSHANPYTEISLSKNPKNSVPGAQNPKNFL